MSEISEAALKEVQEAFKLYEGMVNASDLERSVKQAYTSHPRRFIRWLSGERIDMFERRLPSTSD
jgi:hypothetical protein